MCPYWRGVLISECYVQASIKLGPEDVMHNVFALQGIILVYDITNQKSFENIQKWLSNIEMVS